MGALLVLGFTSRQTEKRSKKNTAAPKSERYAAFRADPPAQEPADQPLRLFRFTSLMSLTSFAPPRPALQNDLAVVKCLELGPVADAHQRGVFRLPAQVAPSACPGFPDRAQRSPRRER